MSTGNWFKDFENFAHCFRAPSSILIPWTSRILIHGVVINMNHVPSIFFENEQLIVVLQYFLKYKRSEGETFGVYLDVDGMVTENIRCSVCRTSGNQLSLPEEQLQQITDYVCTQMQCNSWPDRLVALTAIAMKIQQPVRIHICTVVYLHETFVSSNYQIIGYICYFQKGCNTKKEKKEKKAR